MIIGKSVFENYTYVMAIINLTPDSFWHESRKTADDVLFAVEKAVKAGASVIDLGAQSTRPGYTEVSADEEISRFSARWNLLRRTSTCPFRWTRIFRSRQRRRLFQARI